MADSVVVIEELSLRNRMDRIDQNFATGEEVIAPDGTCYQKSLRKTHCCRLVVEIHPGSCMRRHHSLEKLEAGLVAAVEKFEAVVRSIC